MSYVLGIDIGTSFTAAATARLGQNGPLAPQPLGLGLRGGAVPSVIFLGDDGQVLVGEAAERRGISRPDRVLREFKRRVGDTVPIIVEDLFFAPENIFATMARWVVDRAAEREGTAPEVVMVSHPASWGEYKTGLVRQALAGVGLADVTLVSEPEAAALHYAAQERIEAGKTIAVYDLGGGTFDAAILRKNSAEAFTALGKPAGIERLGGADFDEAVFAHVAASAGSAFENLDTTDPSVLTALSRVRRECVETKEALSSDSEASIPVLLPGTHTEVRLVRAEFESMITGPVQETIATLVHAMEAANVGAEDLDAVLLIGGSSRIPLVAQLLSAQLDRPIAIDADPKASISLGAAYAAASRLQSVADAEAAAVADADRDNDTAEAAALKGGAAALLAAADAPHRRHFQTEDVPFEQDDAGMSAKLVYARAGMRTTAVVATIAALALFTGTAAQSPTNLGPPAAVAGGGTGDLDRVGTDPQAAADTPETDEAENSAAAADEPLASRASTKPNAVTATVGKKSGPESIAGSTDIAAGGAGYDEDSAGAGTKTTSSSIPPAGTPASGPGKLSGEPDAPAAPSRDPSPSVDPTPDTSTPQAPSPAPEPAPSPAPDPAPAPEPAPEPAPVPVPEPEPAPAPVPEPEPAPEPVSAPEPEPAQTTAAPEPGPTPSGTPAESPPPTGTASDPPNSA